MPPKRRPATTPAQSPTFLKNSHELQFNKRRRKILLLSEGVKEQQNVFAESNKLYRIPKLFPSGEVAQHQRTLPNSSCTSCRSCTTTRLLSLSARDNQCVCCCLRNNLAGADNPQCRCEHCVAVSPAFDQFLAVKCECCAEVSPKPAADEVCTPRPTSTNDQRSPKRLSFPHDKIVNSVGSFAPHKMPHAVIMTPRVAFNYVCRCSDTMKSVCRHSNHSVVVDAHDNIDDGHKFDRKAVSYARHCRRTLRSNCDGLFASWWRQFLLLSLSSNTRTSDKTQNYCETARSSRSSTLFVVATAPETSTSVKQQLYTSLKSDKNLLKLLMGAANYTMDAEILSNIRVKRNVHSSVSAAPPAQSLPTQIDLTTSTLQPQKTVVIRQQQQMRPLSSASPSMYAHSLKIQQQLNNSSLRSMVPRFTSPSSNKTLIIKSAALLHGQNPGVGFGTDHNSILNDALLPPNNRGAAKNALAAMDGYQSPVCGGSVQPGYYTDHDSLCQKYYFCRQDGIKFDFTCPQNMTFNRDSMRCVERGLATCEAPPQQKHPQQSLSPHHNKLLPRSSMTPSRHPNSSAATTPTTTEQHMKPQTRTNRNSILGTPSLSYNNTSSSYYAPDGYRNTLHSKSPAATGGGGSNAAVHDTLRSPNNSNSLLPVPRHVLHNNGISGSSSSSLQHSTQTNSKKNIVSELLPSPVAVAPYMMTCEGKSRPFADQRLGCRVYYKCSPNGKISRYECLKRSIYSDELQRCTSAASAKCGGDGGTLTLQPKAEVSVLDFTTNSPNKQQYFPSSRTTSSGRAQMDKKKQLLNNGTRESPGNKLATGVAASSSGKPSDMLPSSGVRKANVNTTVDISKQTSNFYSGSPVGQTPQQTPAIPDMKTMLTNGFKGAGMLPPLVFDGNAIGHSPTNLYPPMVDKYGNTKFTFPGLVTINPNNIFQGVGKPPPPKPKVLGTLRPNPPDIEPDVCLAREGALLPDHEIQCMGYLKCPMVGAGTMLGRIEGWSCPPGLHFEYSKGECVQGTVMCFDPTEPWPVGVTVSPKRLTTVSVTPFPPPSIAVNSNAAGVPSFVFYPQNSVIQPRTPTFNVGAQLPIPQPPPPPVTPPQPQSPASSPSGGGGTINTGGPNAGLPSGSTTTFAVNSKNPGSVGGTLMGPGGPPLKTPSIPANGPYYDPGIGSGSPFLQNANVAAAPGSISGAAGYPCYGRIGYIPDYSQHCQVYYFCSADSNWVNYTCPDTMAFNVIVGMCQPLAHVPQCQYHQPPAPVPVPAPVEPHYPNTNYGYGEPTYNTGYDPYGGNVASAGVPSYAPGGGVDYGGGRGAPPPQNPPYAQQQNPVNNFLNWLLFGTGEMGGFMPGLFDPAAGGGGGGGGGGVEPGPFDPLAGLFGGGGAGGMGGGGGMNGMFGTDPWLALAAGFYTAPEPSIKPYPQAGQKTNVGVVNNSGGGPTEPLIPTKTQSTGGTLPEKVASPPLNLPPPKLLPRTSTASKGVVMVGPTNNNQPKEPLTSLPKQIIRRNGVQGQPLSLPPDSPLNNPANQKPQTRIRQLHQQNYNNNKNLFAEGTIVGRSVDQRRLSPSSSSKNTNSMLNPHRSSKSLLLTPHRRSPENSPYRTNSPGIELTTASTTSTTNQRSSVEQQQPRYTSSATASPAPFSRYFRQSEYAEWQHQRPIKSSANNAQLRQRNGPAQNAQVRSNSGRFARYIDGSSAAGAQHHSSESNLRARRPPGTPAQLQLTSSVKTHNVNVVNAGEVTTAAPQTSVSAQAISYEQPPIVRKIPMFFQDQQQQEAFNRKNELLSDRNSSCPLQAKLATYHLLDPTHGDCRHYKICFENGTSQLRYCNGTTSEEAFDVKLQKCRPAHEVAGCWAHTAPPASATLSEIATHGTTQLPLSSSTASSKTHAVFKSPLMSLLSSPLLRPKSQQSRQGMAFMQMRTTRAISVANSVSPTYSSTTFFTTTPSTTNSVPLLPLSFSRHSNGSVLLDDNSDCLNRLRNETNESGSPLFSIPIKGCRFYFQCKIIERVSPPTSVPDTFPITTSPTTAAAKANIFLVGEAARRKAKLIGFTCEEGKMFSNQHKKCDLEDTINAKTCDSIS